MGKGAVLRSAILVFAVAACDKPEKAKPQSPPTPAAQALEQGARVCTRVVATPLSSTAASGVRYIGIDTPETKHPRKSVQWMGKEASAANRLLVEGKRVRLEYDVERRDKYGRTLAYVWIGDTMVNELLVRAGYAQVSTYPPNVKYVERFLAAQREARENGRGLWGDGADPASDQLLKGAASTAEAEDAPPPSTAKEIVYVTRTGKKYHRAGCQYLRSSKIPMEKSAAEQAGYTPCKTCWK